MHPSFFEGGGVEGGTSQLADISYLKGRDHESMTPYRAPLPENIENLNKVDISLGREVDIKSISDA